MPAHLLTHNDQPSFEDKLGRDKLVQQVAREIARGQPPLVFGIHGDWGAGKTSFLCQLEHELTGECSIHPNEARECTRVSADIENVFTVWFEAWRYQHEPAPVVALLQEICRQLPKHEKVKKVLSRWGTMITKGFFGAIDELSLEMEAAPLGTGGKAGLKFKNPLPLIHEAGKDWDEERLTGRLTADRIRSLLTDALKRLLDDDEHKLHRRVCVIIDDLDRCEPGAALRLLEGIKIYLSVPQCVFVLGVNLRQIEQAIAPLLPGAKDKEEPAERHAEAAEYLEKLCTFTWKLPFPNAANRAALMKLWLADPPHADPNVATPLPEKLREALRQTATEFDCLPANPRKIKALANTIRQLAAKAYGHQGSAPGDLAISETESDALLVSASIYHFHPDLLRYLQTTPSAWTELVNWANGKSKLSDKSDLYRALIVLRPLTIATSGADTAATPSTAARTSSFADPIHLNVFRIEDLLRDATNPSRRNSITYDAMQRYLDLPDWPSLAKGTTAGPAAITGTST